MTGSTIIDGTKVDRVVLGSGAAGLSASVTAALAGLSVVVLEHLDLLGGTSARSSGTVWVPGNRHMQDPANDRAEAQWHLEALSGPRTSSRPSTSCSTRRETSRTAGRIIGLTSSMVRLAVFGVGSYTASKAAVESLLRSMQRELAGRVRVNGVAPGPADTDPFRTGKDEEALQRSAGMSPFNRVGEPREVAEVVVFLASNHVSWIAGKIVPPNGGLMIEEGTMPATVEFSAFKIARTAARAGLRHLAGKDIPDDITVPPVLITAENLEHWKVPLSERDCPSWQEVVE